jgi:hypothetical protein
VPMRNARRLTGSPNVPYGDRERGVRLPVELLHVPARRWAESSIGHDARAAGAVQEALQMVACQAVIRP